MESAGVRRYPWPEWTRACLDARLGVGARRLADVLALHTIAFGKTEEAIGRDLLMREAHFVDSRSLNRAATEMVNAGLLEFDSRQGARTLYRLLVPSGDDLEPAAREQQVRNAQPDALRQQVTSVEPAAQPAAQPAALGRPRTRELEKELQQAVRSSSTPHTVAGPAATATAIHEPLDREQLDPADPVHRLLRILPDADAGTEGVLRSYHHLDDHDWYTIREEVQRFGGGTGLAVTMAKRIHNGAPTFDYQPGARAGTPAAGASRPLYDELEDWVRNVGHEETMDGLLREIADRERRRGETLSNDQQARLIELWRSMNPSGVNALAAQSGPGATAFDAHSQQAQPPIDSLTRAMV